MTSISPRCRSIIVLQLSLLQSIAHIQLAVKLNCIISMGTLISTVFPK